MKKVIRTYVSRSALIFSLSVIVSIFINLFNGNSTGNYIFLLELLGFVIVIGIIDYWIAKFQFSSRPAYLAAEFSIMYGSFLIFSYFGHWFSFKITHLLLFTAIFCILFFAVHLYYYFSLKNDAAAINEKLKKS